MNIKNNFISAVISIIVVFSNIFPGYTQKEKIKPKEALLEIASIIDGSYEFLGKTTEEVEDSLWSKTHEEKCNLDIKYIEMKIDTIESANNGISIITPNGLIILTINDSLNLVFALTYIPHKQFDLTGEKIFKFLRRKFNQDFNYNSIQTLEKQFVRIFYLNKAVMLMAQNSEGDILYSEGIPMEKDVEIKEKVSYPKIVEIEDYKDVSIVTQEADITGLVEIGVVFAKASDSFTTEIAMMKALIELKIRAAMMGANVIFLENANVNKSDNDYWSWKWPKAIVTGWVYSNQLPLYDDFVEFVKDKTIFRIVTQYIIKSGQTKFKTKTVNKEIKVDEIIVDKRLIKVKAQILEDNINGIFMVTHLTEDGFQLYYQDDSHFYNFVIKL